MGNELVSLSISVVTDTIIVIITAQRQCEGHRS
jgi:hypothetical protein